MRATSYRSGGCDGLAPSSGIAEAYAAYGLAGGSRPGAEETRAL